MLYAQQMMGWFDLHFGCALLPFPDVTHAGCHLGRYCGIIEILVDLFVICNEARLEMSGEPPPVLVPPRQRGGGGDLTKRRLRKKWRIMNSHKHINTRLIIDVTSEISPLAIEGFKDADGKANPAGRLIKI